MVGGAAAECRDTDTRHNYKYFYCNTIQLSTSPYAGLHFVHIVNLDFGSIFSRSRKTISDLRSSAAALLCWKRKYFSEQRIFSCLPDILTTSAGCAQPRQGRSWRWWLQTGRLECLDFDIDTEDIYKRWFKLVFFIFMLKIGPLSAKPSLPGDLDRRDPENHMRDGTSSILWVYCVSITVSI